MVEQTTGYGLTGLRGWLVSCNRHRNTHLFPLGVQIVTASAVPPTRLLEPRRQMSLQLLSRAVWSGRFFIVKVQEDAAAAVSCCHSAPRNTGHCNNQHGWWRSNVLKVLTAVGGKVSHSESLCWCWSLAAALQESTPSSLHYHCHWWTALTPADLSASTQAHVYCEGRPLRGFETLQASSPQPFLAVRISLFSDSIFRDPPLKMWRINTTIGYDLSGMQTVVFYKCNNKCMATVNRRWM